MFSFFRLLPFLLLLFFPFLFHCGPKTLPEARPCKNARDCQPQQICQNGFCRPVLGEPFPIQTIPAEYLPKKEGKKGESPSLERRETLSEASSLEFSSERTPEESQIFDESLKNKEPLPKDEFGGGEKKERWQEGLVEATSPEREATSEQGQEFLAEYVIDGDAGDFSEPFLEKKERFFSENSREMASLEKTSESNASETAKEALPDELPPESQEAPLLDGGP